MIRIISCPTFAHKILECAIKGMVHSVYRNTINIACGDGILALQPARVPLTPLSLETDLSPDRFSTLGVRPGLAVKVGCGGIVLGEWRFEGSDMRIWDSAITAAPGSAFGASGSCTLTLQEGIRALAHKGGFADIALPEGDRWRSSKAARHAMGQLEAIRQLSGQDNWDEAVRSAVALVGLGDGLTPSGDDFLCGMLAGLFMKRENERARDFLHALRRGILAAAEQTNDISASFLCGACAGHFSRAVLMAAEGPPLEALVREFDRIGHSSGVDTLNGLLFSLELCNA